MYKDILGKLTNGIDLNAEEVSEIISDIREDKLTEGQISGFLVALVMKGTTLEETAYIARAMRENCIPIRPGVEAEMMDTCGTGGGLTAANIREAVRTFLPDMADVMTGVETSPGKKSDSLLDGLTKALYLRT